MFNSTVPVHSEISAAIRTIADPFHQGPHTPEKKKPPLLEMIPTGYLRMSDQILKRNKALLWSSFTWGCSTPFLQTQNALFPSNYLSHPPLTEKS